MAYTDQPAMSPRKLTSIIIVVLMHIFLGYAFVSGLAYKAVKQIAPDLKTFDVEEAPPPPPETPPPPPEVPKDIPPPPIVAPPPIVQTQSLAPPIVTVPTPPPAPVITPTAPPAPPAPPRVSKAAGAKGDPAQWITNDDYPPGALREERSGTTAITWDINTQGRVENCRVTQSSGSSDLDEAACRLITRRGKYSPALDENGQPLRSTASRRVKWVVPAN
ncbi:energy transducer TonB [Sphingomonas sp. ID0503]|uniref:energy transducer TonB n=1 Tax=Sphingomonas sp. ID0503 TaxID=3399691 RepID=UPI003AFA6C29